jgi:transcriptional regulator with XRE-family HTH domain
MDFDDWKHVAGNVACEMRETCGMSQREVTEFSGISRGSVTRVEKGENVTVALLLAYLDAVDCSLEDFARRVEEHFRGRR